MRWYVLLALVVIFTLLVIEESESWGRRRWKRVRVRRAVRHVRTRRIRRFVPVRTRRLRRIVRVRTRRLRRLVPVRTRRLRRVVRVRTRRLRRLVRRVRTRRLRRLVRRVRTRRLRRSIRRKIRRIRFRTKKLIRIRTRRVLKKFKIKKLTRKVKKLLKKVKKLPPFKKPGGKWWSKLQDWIKGKIIASKEMLQKWGSKLKGLISKEKEPPEEGTSGPGVQPTDGSGVQPTDGPPPTKDPFLEVKQGNFTFEAEGDDNSSSPYFSRKLHVFSNTSGVTVGRGYDVKEKMILQIKRDLTLVGIQNSIAMRLMNAIHLEGDSAKIWIKNNKLESFMITTQQQKKLFELEYPRKLNKAKTTVEKYSKTGLKFDHLKQVVKDLIVDIFYRGDYSMSDSDQDKKECSQIMQEVFDQSQTSLKPMTVLMLDEEFWLNFVRVDIGRYYIRSNYIADACEKDANCDVGS
ncbi:uncharacterized protein LOC116301671 [Actinia tenebrosa]|uniref:Uncharacterized protein LOC116301671 n=1 Tax=Actinia tenebrosa TaxID=6105 RepID=A0A6P8IIJ4_ACTTE|nr:uncharacterized protein LOC116301671 [Actinia tenebrosa]